jgi:hypothetical protein
VSNTDLTALSRYLDDPTFTNDLRLKYMPRWTHSAWDPARARQMYGRSSAQDLAFAKKEFQKDLERVSAMQKAGVGILAPMQFYGQLQ